MNRKKFLSSVIAISAAIPTLPSVREKRAFSQVPPYLQSGDTIGITCPAGAISLKEVQPAIQQIESWGYRIKLGQTVGKKDFTFGGTDEERAADFQQMLDDPSIKAILCARGGYGAVHIIDRLDFSGLSWYPKWIIGFSDITVLHCHLDRNYNIASIHSKMCNSFPDDWSKAEPIQVQTIGSIRQALAGERMLYSITPAEKNREGVAEGPLVGGNLKTIETLAGTRSDIHTGGKILFLEDTGEYLYSIDRMFRNLDRTGKLSGLKGLVVGGFKIKPDDPGEEFGRTLYDIVMDRVKQYTYPVCFDFPVGHQKNNFALKCGVKHRLEVGAGKAVLEEVAI
jgi:muramoyltetrapeptide carboxypeptidase